jgi:hypothetical protein
MKNIHILPTEDKGRITKYNKELHIEKIAIYNEPSIKMEVFNIYITNNEEIKEGDWHLKPKYSSAIKIGYEINQADSSYFGGYGYDWTYCKKIILTTDLDLIKDGVQAIDDEFLEWFVKNPSCESVEVIQLCKIGCEKLILNGINSICCGDKEYKIIIPKEEPKQETIEEGFDRIFDSIDYSEFDYTSFKLGAKWQQERSYSEEEVENILIEYVKTNPTKPYRVVQWFQQFKKQ